LSRAVKNVAKTKTAPKVTDEEMVIVKDVPGLVAKLPPGPIYAPAMIALFRSRKPWRRPVKVFGQSLSLNIDTPTA
jgi:hypothetical protein